IATVIGRYYAMDRDNRWERTKEAYDALTLGTGVKAESAVDAVEESYAAGDTDEFIKPIVIVNGDGTPVTTVKDKDSVIFFNFRPDRARQITKCFCLDDFEGFKREKRIETCYVCFTEYDVTIPNKLIAFKKTEINNTLGEYVSSLGLKQARIAETEKYAHVTFFFNGGIEKPYEGEDRFLVNSPKVATYDLKPEMSAYEVCDRLCEAITSKKYDLIVINFANPDMVGHTGVMEAAIKACEAVDTCVGRVVEALLSVDGTCFMCADHGNSEQLIDYETGESFTAHTTNPVPFILINYEKGVGLREGGCLADIAPTLLEIMKLPQPAEMTGKSLLVR
ncbi:MAG: 2,3-bisphosphoglycerate-independent phosphoglycerate mutase, partial [Lachnospiraceae bacterium]|nr:2,3-bisphosphoglycerate-independent phosphoglycerate mutase [Lachnospiraceae bacterium]